MAAGGPTLFVKSLHDHCDKLGKLGGSTHLLMLHKRTYRIFYTTRAINYIHFWRMKDKWVHYPQRVACLGNTTTSSRCRIGQNWAQARYTTSLYTIHKNILILHWIQIWNAALHNVGIPCWIQLILAGATTGATTVFVLWLRITVLPAPAVNPADLERDGCLTVNEGWMKGEWRVNGGALALNKRMWFWRFCMYHKLAVLICHFILNVVIQVAY